MDLIVKSFVVVIGVAILTLMSAVFILPLVALQAYVISDLWSLFITPWINVSMPVSIWTTAGVLLTIRVAATGINSSSKKDDKKSEDKSWVEVATPFVSAYLGVLLIWGMGHLFYWLST